jgi:signal transduction histidine kinase/integral membrane sensor domain MASE1
MILRISQCRRELLTIVMIAIAYFLSGKFAFALVNLDSRAEASVLYPPIGISLAAVLLSGRFAWLGVTLGALGFARSLEGVSWFTAFGAAFGSTIEVMVAQQLLNRVGFDRSLQRVRDAIAFIGIAAAFAPGLNATISTLNGFLGGFFPSSEIVNHWFEIWLGDAVSILVLTPAPLVWGTRPPKILTSFSAFKAAWNRNALFRRHTLEVAIWLGLVVICTWLALTGFFIEPPTKMHGVVGALLHYLPFLFIVWAVLRLGQRGTVLSSVLISLVSIAAVSEAYHGFAGAEHEYLQHTLFHLQTFIGVMTMIALVLAAAIAERQQVEQLLRRQIQQDQFLAEGTLRIRQSLDVTEVLNTTVAEVRRFLNVDRVYISVFDPEGYTDIVAESISPGWHPMLGTRSPRPILPDIREIFDRESIRVNPDSDTAIKNEFLKVYYHMYQIKASIATPIMQNGRYFGVLNVIQCSGPRQWQSFEVELVKRLATQVELAVQQGCLYQQVQNTASNLERQVQERTMQLQQNMDQLQEINEVKDTLLHAVAHDLRTPLMGTLMVLKRLQDRSEDNVLLSRSILDRLIDSSDRQLSLIRSLLEDSSESSKLVLTFEAVRLQDLIHETVQNLDPLLSQNRVSLQNSVTDDLPAFSADAIQLKQVVEHLITNAVTHNTPGVEIAIGAEIADGKLRCTIADNGTGMTHEQCDQLFKRPFLRGSHNHHRTGLGLGLFLCNQIIAAHGGEIGVNSSPSAGATFWFTVPLERRLV